jgi:signal recognition particle subunit SRP72
MRDEMAVLEVQKGFVWQLQGKREEALAVYTAALNDKPSDEAVVATASNNIIAMRRKDEKMFDSLKRSERASKVSQDKLSLRQKSAIQLNRSLLLLRGKKGEQGVQDVAALQKEFPGSEFPVLVLASLYYREKQGETCAQVLDDFIKAYPTNSTQCRYPFMQHTIAHPSSSTHQ